MLPLHSAPHRAQAQRWSAIARTLRVRTALPAWLTQPWLPPLLRSGSAMLAEGAATLVGVPLARLVPGFGFRGLLDLLVVAIAALAWGVTPSVLATLTGAVLLGFVAPPTADGPGSLLSTFVGSGLFVLVGLIVSLSASRTARARASAQVEARRAERALQERNELLTVLAHDLRSPLSGILARTHLLQRRLNREQPPSIAQLHADTESIAATTTRMLAMVAEMSDAARLQMGHALDLQRAPVNVAMLVRAIAADAEVADVPPRIVVVGPDEVCVSADSMRLARAIENVLGNALKYSPAHTPVHVTLQQEPAAVVLVVRDQGVGIPADELSHIFTRFFRASTSAGVAGSGIGLATAKAIVEQHGGTITVESQEGRDTTVTIRLPAGELRRLA